MGLRCKVVGLGWGLQGFGPKMENQTEYPKTQQKVCLLYRGLYRLLHFGRG